MSIALIRSMDTQGRIIIPADIRKETGIQSGSTLEIATEGATIRIRKCRSPFPGRKELPEFLEPLHRKICCGAAVCNAEYILASTGCFLPEGSTITPELRSLVLKQEEQIFQADMPTPVPEGSTITPELRSLVLKQEEQIFQADMPTPVPGSRRTVAALFPVRLSPASKEAALLLVPETGRTLAATEQECARLVANMITRKYEERKEENL